MLCMRLNDTIPLKFHPSQTRTRMPCILYLLYIPCARARVRVVCARRACKCAEQNACSNTHRHARTHARTWRRGVQYPPPLYFGSVKRAVYLVYSYAGAFCAPAHSRRRRRLRRRRLERGVRFRGRTKWMFTIHTNMRNCVRAGARWWDREGEHLRYLQLMRWCKSARERARFHRCFPKIGCCVNCAQKGRRVVAARRTCKQACFAAV